MRRIKYLKYIILVVTSILFITVIPNFSNAAKTSVGKVSKIWVSYTTSSKIKVKWKKVKGAKGYKVYKYNYSKKKYELFATTSNTSLKVKNLKSAEKYKFRVRAYKKKSGKNYYGKYSPSVKSATAPEQVKNLRLKDQSDSTLSIKWDKTKRATSYKIYVYNDYTKNYDYKLSSSNNSIKLVGMNPAKSYKIRVRAYKKSDNKKYYGEYSNIIVAKTTPSKVTGLKEYDYSVNSVSLMWNKISNECTYRVYMYNSSKKSYEKQGDIKNTYFKISNLSPATEYRFKVRAYVTINGKKYFGAYSSVVDTGTSPNKAKGLKINKTTKKSIEIKWDKVKEATGYAIYVYRDSSQSFKLYTTTTNTSVNITGLNSAKFYKMYIKAYAKINGKTYYSSASTTISGKTDSTDTEIAGIDVSAHNQKIDWEKVKKAGVEFAILRCGFGQDYKSQDDKYFARNLAECERLEIPYGVYIYSYALNTKQASSEADHALRLIKGHTVKYGVWFDMEDADGYKKKHGMPSNKTLVNICIEFCDKMIKNGFKTGIYASLSWFNGKLKDSKLDKYDKWVAQWNDRCSYTKDYVMWQYTSSGLVDGISGRTDMNIMYLKITEEPVTPTPVEPETPTPEEPTPDTPTPEEPTPENPTPDTPTPDTPTPEEPTPENPTPDNPTTGNSSSEDSSQEEQNNENSTSSNTEQP